MNAWSFDFGCQDYDSTWALQKHLLERRIQQEIPDVLLVGEHPHVITLGRGSHLENLLNPNIPVVEIERGGDVTYHGPGQLIGYPIFQLGEGERDLHRYLRNLEEALRLTLLTFDLESHRKAGWTGLWVQAPGQGEKKIASIGVAVKKWVTYHGIALNISTDLSYFTQINPCGLESGLMTSLSQCLGESITLAAVQPAFLQSITQVFGRPLQALTSLPEATALHPPIV